MVCKYFGVPLAEGKTILPTTCLEFLGITLDSAAMEFRLPEDKVYGLSQLLQMFMRKRKVTLREMQTLLGQLAFATRVLPMGRVFSRRLYSAIAGLKNPSAHVRVSTEIKKDLLVWIQFLEHYNGKTMWQQEFVFESEFMFQTDAAGSVGFGAVWGTQWCADRWVLNGFCKNIVLLELFPVVVALEIWGPLFTNKRLVVSTDNKGVAFAVNSLLSKSPPVVLFLSHLVFLCLRWNIWIKARYVLGKNNEIADSLSRRQMDRFFRLLPVAEKVGVPPLRSLMGPNLICQNIRNSVAPSTWRNYVSSWLLWVTFLNSVHLSVSDHSEQIVLSFLHSLIMKKYSWSHINKTLSGISFFLPLYNLPACHEFFSVRPHRIIGHPSLRTFCLGFVGQPWQFVFRVTSLFCFLQFFH